jgi:hypothetical protein
MLAYIANYDNIIPLSNINNAVSEYFHKRKLIDKRLKEQIATGSLKYIDDHTIEMTERGKRIVKMNILIGRLFNLDTDNYCPTLGGSPPPPPPLFVKVTKK